MQPRRPATGIVDGFEGAVGNTPLIRLRRASEATGCEILGKAEFMNPGGSVKDRAGLGIILDAERRGLLTPGKPGTIVEGTAGNTGIGITLVANARGYRAVIVVPETQSREKIDFLRMIGADLRLIPAEALSPTPATTCISAAAWRRRWARSTPTSSTTWPTAPRMRRRRAPRSGTQTDGRVDAFTCSCGTGGTLAGVARALKARKPGARIVLADPMGSALYSWVKTGELKAEGNSITEGIGQAARVPGNLEPDRALIDDAVQVTRRGGARTGLRPADP